MHGSVILRLLVGEFRPGAVLHMKSDQIDNLLQKEVLRRSFITTHEIARDAVDLLRDSRDTVELLEQSEGKIDAFLQALINKIDHDDLVQRFNGLTGEASDSVARLSANQITQAYEFWYDAQKKT